MIESLSTIKNIWKKKKSNCDEVTNSYDKKNPKANCNSTCLAVISLDSALKENHNYYLQVLLKFCKYIKKKVVWNIHDNLSIFSYSLSLIKNKLEWVKFISKSTATEPCKTWQDDLTMNNSLKFY